MFFLLRVNYYLEKLCPRLEASSWNVSRPCSALITHVRFCLGIHSDGTYECKQVAPSFHMWPRLSFFKMKYIILFYIPVFFSMLQLGHYIDLFIFCV